MADTGEDSEITMDTSPIRGAVRYTASSEDVAPGAVRHFATDDFDTRIPAQSSEHAADLAEALTLVEFQHFGSSGWLSLGRRFTLWLMRWLNAHDPRSEYF
jgi:hypothetical protein